MEFENYWGISKDSQEELKYTNNIHKIMEEQCKYLVQDTNGKVFAVFGEIKTDGSMHVIAQNISNLFKGVSGITGVQETVAELSTKNLINANDMYFDKRYGFEICTEKYRFRLFELRMTPIYPVEIIIDEGICKNIGNALARIAIQMEKFNHFKVSDEKMFCDVLQNILQDKKVHYIIGELQKRVPDKKENEDCLPEKVIICEGQTEEIVLQAIAQKLCKKVTIIIANGKYNVPAIFDTVKVKNTKSDILIVVDSDGNEKETQKAIHEKIDNKNCDLVIINDHIEDWFMPEVADFSKLKLMQSMDSIVDESDLEELSKNHESLAKVVDFLRE